jgi:hypothetical protein
MLSITHNIGMIYDIERVLLLIPRLKVCLIMHFVTYLTIITQ